uniref:Uncharacterized protein n=1 Tax=Rhizophora mucronata TaxID=61149 RepID=A0A2P2P4T0_RHIMU
MTLFCFVVLTDNNSEFRMWHL